MAPGSRMPGPTRSAKNPEIMKAAIHIALLFAILASSALGEAPPPKLVPTDGVSQVAQFFREHRYLSEFKQPVEQGGSSHWGEHECSMDKGARIRYENSGDLATYIARIRDRLAQITKDAGGEFSVGSMSGGPEQPFRLIAMYRIGDRRGFIRLANSDVDLQRKATEGDFSFILWEVPLKNGAPGSANAESGPRE